MLMLLALVLGAMPTLPAEWTTLAPGIEARAFELVKKPEHGDGKLQVVRIDPKVAHLELALAKQVSHGIIRTAAEWADEKKFVATINVGMYEVDFGTNVGFLRNGDYVNQKKWKSSYESVLLAAPKDPKAPAVQLVDRDAPGFDAQLAGYATVVQNLRVIKGPPAQSVWSNNSKKWSEAMVAQDDKGRLLFCFSRTPFEMSELATKVLALPLGVVRAMHVEGGPEASLSVRGKGLKLDFAGSYETGFFVDDSNEKQWRIPNVIGVR